MPREDAEVTVAAPGPGPSKVDALVDRWWSDNVAVLQRSVVEWGPAVEAKDELKKRIASAGPNLFK